MVEACVSDANTIAVLENELYTQKGAMHFFFFSVELVFDGGVCDIDEEDICTGSFFAGSRSGVTFGLSTEYAMRAVQ